MSCSAGREKERLEDFDGLRILQNLGKILSANDMEAETGSSRTPKGSAWSLGYRQRSKSATWVDMTTMRMRSFEKSHLSLN